MKSTTTKGASTSIVCLGLSKGMLYIALAMYAAHTWQAYVCICMYSHIR